MTECVNPYTQFLPVRKTSYKRASGEPDSGFQS
jgi:hypothetical protein